MNAPSFGITHCHSEYAQTVYLAGEIDYAASIELSPRLDDILEECPSELLFDLGRVEFIDSEGIKILIRAFVHMRNKGGQARIVNYSDRVRRTVELAGVQSVFDASPVAPALS